MSHRIRFHPLVKRDLDEITSWIIDCAGREAAGRRLSEIRETIASLADVSHRGSIRNEIAPGVRAIPAGRRAVVSFTVDDEAREVHVQAVTHGEADWAARIRKRAR